MNFKWQKIWTVIDKSVVPCKELSNHKTEREALEKVRKLYEESPKGKWDYISMFRVYY